MKSVVSELRLYLTRPIIPFCFGVPLLLPAALLTTVAFLQDHISPLLHVLGILFLSLSLLSITYGMVLGFRDVCRNKTKIHKRPVTRGFEKVKRKIPGGLKTPNTNSVSPESLTPNSQGSSRRSSCSAGSTGSHVVVTNEMVRLVPTKGRKVKKHSRFFLPRTSCKPGKHGRMPAVQEEDHTHPGENGDVHRSNSFMSSKTDPNLQQLESVRKM
ncbi:hypothetical protein ACOMHN_046787 [Nucella lapillus]